MKIFQILAVLTLLNIATTLFCLEKQESKIVEAAEKLSDSPTPPF